MLYICPTPIGNLEDITIRVLNTLERADLIACEDTRVTGRLLKHYDINTGMTSLHKYNILSKMDYIVDLLKTGKDIAYVSDAGMPGISDPGQELVRRCQDEGIDYTVLPGASASVTALVMSGLDNERFTFVGFLDSRSNPRKTQLKELESSKETMIFYESPHRVISTLEDMLEIFGDREVAVIREISKIYEEINTGTITDILEKGITEKGEIAIVVEGSIDESVDIDIKKELENLIDQGNSKRDSVKIVSDKYSLPRNEVYDVSLKL